MSNPRSTRSTALFVNLPVHMKHDAPDSLHVPGATMPVIQGDGRRVRVVLGETQGVAGASSPALPLTILDVQVDAGSGYIHDMPARQGAWLHAVRGDARIRIDGRTTQFAEGEAIALRIGSTKAALEIHSGAGAQVVLLQGTPICERFVQQGPLVMTTHDELRAVAADYAAGRLGSID